LREEARLAHRHRGRAALRRPAAPRARVRRVGRGAHRPPDRDALGRPGARSGDPAREVVSCLEVTGRCETKPMSERKGERRTPETVRPDLGGPFPEHIAIIMDGNGRWAEERGLRRVFGHREGIDSVREVTTECARMGVKSLTLYAFSVENWKRPRAEVRYLMRLLRHFLVEERPTLMDNDVRLACIGRLDD